MATTMLMMIVLALLRMQVSCAWWGDSLDYDHMRWQSFLLVTAFPSGGHSVAQRSVAVFSDIDAFGMYIFFFLCMPLVPLLKDHSHDVLG